MRDFPERRLSSPGRLPSDIDGDIDFCRCPYCNRDYDRQDMTQDWTPTRGVILVCKQCREGRDEP